MLYGTKNLLLDVWCLMWAISCILSPELLILPAVDENVDGGVEDKEKVGEKCEDLTPHWPVVEWSRAVDKKKTDLQHNSPVLRSDCRLQGTEKEEIVSMCPNFLLLGQKVYEYILEFIQNTKLHIHFNLLTLDYCHKI